MKHPTAVSFVIIFLCLVCAATMYQVMASSPDDKFNDSNIHTGENSDNSNSNNNNDSNSNSNNNSNADANSNSNSNSDSEKPERPWMEPLSVSDILINDSNVSDHVFAWRNVLVGLSAKKCQECGYYEPIYENLIKRWGYAPGIYVIKREEMEEKFNRKEPLDDEKEEEDVVNFDKTPKQYPEKIVFARVDVEDASDIVKKFSVKHLPSLLLFHYGKAYHYLGDQTYDDLDRWIWSVVAGPHVLEIGDEQHLESFIRDNWKGTTATAVGFFPGGEKNYEKEHEAWSSLIKENGRRPDLRFAEVSDSSLGVEYMKKQWYTTAPSVVIVRANPFDKKLTLMSRKLREDHNTTLREWVAKSLIPRVGPLSPATWRWYNEVNLPLAVVFVHGNNKSMLESVVKILAEIEPRYRDRLSLAYMDVDVYAHHLSSVGVGQNEKLPVIAITEPGKLYGHPQNIEFSKDIAIQFLEYFVAGKLKPVPPEEIERRKKEELEKMKKKDEV